MTSEEQVQICKLLAITCMWGHGGIASVMLDRLEKQMPMDKCWRDVFDDNEQSARREYLGVITDEKRLRDKLSDGYWLTNGDSLFNPPPMNGLCCYVDKALYDKYAPRR